MPDHLTLLAAAMTAIKEYARACGLRARLLELHVEELPKPLRHIIPPSDQANGAAVCPAPVEVSENGSPRAPTLTDVQEEIMRVLRGATRPMKANAIARAAGRVPSGYFRTALKCLVEWNLVTALPGHFYADAARVPNGQAPEGRAV